jgi:elongation factor P
MIDVNDLRKGTTFILDSQLYRVLEYSHNKPGRGSATIRTKVRNMRTGTTMEKTFISGDRVQDVRVESREMQYLYHDGDLYHFMDTETFEQFAMNAETLGNAISYMTDNMQIIVEQYEGESLGVQLPTAIDLKVVQAEASVKGDTATGATKQVTVETGLRVTVPLFVKEGDVIRIDTRTGEYVTRV